MSNVGTGEMLAFYAIIGTPFVLAWVVVDIEWAIEIATFTCAWWVAWTVMVERND